MQTFKKPSTGGGGGVGVSIANEQMAFGTGEDLVGGHNDLKWDGSKMIIQGSSANRFIRFIESAGQYNGGFIQFDGAANKMRFGVHPTGDAIEGNDIQSMTFLRSSGYVGVFNDVPTANFHINGNLKVNANSRIEPTYTDLPKLAISKPSFGGTRLGDSLLQSPSIDTQILSFKDDAQGTQATIFINASGDTMTIKGFDDGILVVDQTSKGVDFATEDAESTFANSIEDSVSGGRYINDQGVQRYVANGSVVAQTHFQVLQNTGGLSRMGFWKGFYDGTTYKEIYKIDTDGILKFNQLQQFQYTSLLSHSTGATLFDSTGTLTMEVFYVGGMITIVGDFTGVISALKTGKINESFITNTALPDALKPTELIYFDIQAIYHSSGAWERMFGVLKTDGDLVLGVTSTPELNTSSHTGNFKFTVSYPMVNGKTITNKAF